MTMVTPLFFPNDGLVTITSYSPCLAPSASLTNTGTGELESPPMPCNSRFIEQSHATPCTSSTPRSCAVFVYRSCVLSGFCRRMNSCAASRKPPMPHSGSQITSPGLGRIASYDCVNQRVRCEVLAGTAFDVFWHSFAEALRRRRP